MNVIVRAARQVRDFRRERPARIVAVHQGFMVEELDDASGVKGGEKSDQRAEQNTATTALRVRGSEGVGIRLGVAAAGNAARA